MEFYLDILLYAPYVTATLLCLVTYCFYLESRQVFYQSRSCSPSLDTSGAVSFQVNRKRRNRLAFVYRKRPTKETIDDEEPPSFY
ncbi:hypothetical protein [Bacillus tianshenii]|uniref:hypothetical protein n=1 Tax=Sutcliffiella tianshenii TaxID=1463404 RepID=UPI0019568007|nr:hypothetical protein [Bacillus tianshenii]